MVSSIPTNLAVEVIEDLSSIKSLEREWREIEQRTPEATGFQSFDWCYAWAELAASTGTPARPRIVLVREGGHLRMLWPLQIERIYGINWARSLGQPITQYCDALAEPSPDRSTWRACAETAVRRWHDIDLLFLVQVRRDGVLADAAFKSMRTAHAEAPYVAFEANFSTTFSKSVRRGERRLARHGRVVIVEANGARARRDAALLILDLKTQWLSKKRQNWQIFNRPLSRRFIASLAERGILRVYLLKVGSAIAAGDIGIIGSNNYRSLVSAYDIRLAGGSPGHVLTRLLLEQLYARGLQSFDFLAPREPYKAKLATGAVEISAIYVVLNFKGRFGAFAASHFRPVLHVIRRWWSARSVGLWS